MSQEILYTSAPRGLKPGSRGFSTVVSTFGMSKTLAERLESLSGYRHAFLPPDPNTRYNPINYSHLKITVGGRRYHVLSRIADAGQDYTGRTNKLAHHVALEESEILACRQGPAELLAQDGFCETAWDGQTSARHPGRAPQAGDAVGRACSTWAAITGDAGWAGVLAGSAVNDRSRPVSVIFPPGTDTLALVIEAMSVLPAEQRWSVAFSTYFTRLPAGVDCFWRFLLDGSPEAQAVRRNPHLAVIDLCHDLEVPDESATVSAARKGRVVGGPPTPRRARPPVPRIPATHQAASAGDEQWGVLDLESCGIQPPWLPEEHVAGDRADTHAGQAILPQRVAVRRRSWKTRLAAVAAIIASAVLVFCLAAGGLLAWRHFSPRQDRGTPDKTKNHEQEVTERTEKNISLFFPLAPVQTLR